MKSASPALPSVLLSALLLVASQVAHATTLQEAWQAAQQHDREFAAAQAAHQAGDARREQARALWRPSVMLSATAGKMSNDTHTTGAQFAAPGFGQSNGVNFDTSIDTGTMTRYTLSAKQPLLSRERLAQSRQLSLSADVAEAEWQNARQSLMLRVAERYFDVVVASENLRLLRQQDKAVERTFNEARDRYKLGSSPVTDTHEAQARAETVKAQVLAAETDLQIRQIALTDLTGIAPDSMALMQPDATPAPQGLLPLDHWLKAADQNNPALRMQAKSQDVAEEEAAKHSAAGAPSVDLVAQMGRDRLHGSGDYGSAENTSSNRMIGVQLNIPLFTGGYRSAKHEEALRMVDKARADGDHLRQQIALQTRSAWLGITTGGSRVAALEQALKASRARLDATRLGREVGDRTTLNLLNAESDTTAAELALLQARVALVMDHLRLAALAGNLDENELTSVSRTIQGATTQR
ncbi:MAG TPA: TolC family outer membrane protein [Noviherbaspirillum sp.]|uniref:TolC family outer membrane protein n=1 Tax=Noviherbaspirillum sp. TaxID=1926288 RepID=UPI002B486550|nr:TolC family outer membrane protein [Noviherbaspirillum sp.]HJV85258.1 TolC family outer membrane protein [Noviherbaspirillum sp.]